MFTKYYDENRRKNIYIIKKAVAKLMTFQERAILKIIFNVTVTLRSDDL